MGGTVDEAAYLYTLMERSCEIQLMVDAAAANGIPKVYVEDEAAAFTFKMSSDPYVISISKCLRNALTLYTNL